jgi:hypothetical protein
MSLVIVSADELHLLAVNNSSTKLSAIASRPRQGALVLAIEPLARRARPADGASTAAVLGGALWLVRVWKRMSVRVTAPGWILQRATTMLANLPRQAFARLILAGTRVSLFRSVSMAFRF